MDVNRLKGRAQDFLKQHEGQLESGVSKAQQFAKNRTAKHGDKIDKVAGKLTERLRGLTPDDEPAPNPTPEPGSAPGADPGSPPAG